MQNVGANDGIGGMAYTERKVVNYLYKHHDVSVYYSAMPVYIRSISMRSRRSGRRMPRRD